MRQSEHRPRRVPVTKFRVAFDGEWQEDFDTLSDAAEWAQQVSGTGRTTWVVERRSRWLLRRSNRLRAVFPEEARGEAEKSWLWAVGWTTIGSS